MTCVRRLSVLSVQSPLPNLMKQRSHLVCYIYTYSVKRNYYLAGMRTLFVSGPFLLVNCWQVSLLRNLLLRIIHFLKAGERLSKVHISWFCTHSGFISEHSVARRDSIWPLIPHWLFKAPSVFMFNLLNFTDVQRTGDASQAPTFALQTLSFTVWNRLLQPKGGWGVLLCFEDRTPPQGLLSSENKSCKIFVIQPPLVLFREESRHISLLVNFTPCNHNFI